MHEVRDEWVWKRESKSVEVKINVGWLYPHGEVERGEMEERIKIKVAREAPGIYNLTTDMLQYGDVVLEWTL